MNKTTMYIALGIIVIGIIFMFANQNKNTVNTDTTNTQIPENNMTTSVPSAFSGTKNADTTASNFLWTAKKKVITSWIDTGTVRICPKVLLCLLMATLCLVLQLLI